MTVTKTIVITGASDGIGSAAARALHDRGHDIVVVGRSPDKTRAVAAELGVDHHFCDFSRLEEVRHLAAVLLERYPKIDVLCNNAGGIMATRTPTIDGHELTFQVNHLAPFLLTSLLMPRLIESRSSVIATSSSAARWRGSSSTQWGRPKAWPPMAYPESKLANIMFTKELARRYAGAGLSAASFEPGAVASNFGDESPRYMRMIYKSALRRVMLTPEQGADTLVWLANGSPATDWTSGRHYVKRRDKKAPSAADDPSACQRLWQLSQELTTIHGE